MGYMYRLRVYLLLYCIVYICVCVCVHCANMCISTTRRDAPVSKGSHCLIDCGR